MATALNATTLYATMFEDMYRLDKEKAAVAGFTVPHQSTEQFWGGGRTSHNCLANGSRDGPRADSLRTEPTTNTPKTSVSMSSEHSFMANSASAPHPPPLAAQPGGTASNAAAQAQVQPGHPSFRRQRASRACETCHARKVSNSHALSAAKSVIMT
ncbi:hypothetical protein BU23DRAFT_4400 [Bimuria novae-zelandiae CBS 107.79]|uniref:Uncharacterized protein n=1 Tax=Bimuria novae-zelandiae CBS 107.79 TaxID=1447943 RepID=A0A6A5VTY0_9PLEO|nr:hypothetical protein BU23DRAFT_4400 [Bimuria novae-zelandiae CBS 107.79]